ncbi:hypothetical protein TCDM_13186 [Trypanosoma cruzi Dm28c]|uniref:Uncharacterized protein n=1 Tax=Trypanosoma cruzi Dm28c TaxID=1416333 RepID=V5ANX5_TRYCR|nr:hypothetical protein TCDM_13186 [Trypanosoma cruzi Dm28c]
MPNQHRRIPQELGKMGSIEKHIASGVRKATDTTVPAGGRQPPELRRREALRGAPKSCWRALRSKPEATADNSRQAACRVYAPRPEHASHESGRHRAQHTPERQPDKAVGGGSSTAPKAPLSAADPGECEGPRPPQPWRSPSAPYGCSRDACVQKPSGGIGDAWLSSSPSSSQRKRHPTATPPTRHADQLPRQAHGTHPRRHRVPVGPIISPLTDCCASGPPCAAMPPQHRMPTLLGVNFRNPVEWARAWRRSPRKQTSVHHEWHRFRPSRGERRGAPCGRSALRRRGRRPCTASKCGAGWPSQRPAPRRIRTLQVVRESLREYRKAAEWRMPCWT